MGTPIYDSERQLVGYLAETEPESHFVKHERAITMAAIVVIPLLLVAFLMWREQQERIEDIQRSRAEITYTSCLEQNDRHDATVERLDKILLERKAMLRQEIIAAEDAGDVEQAALLRAQIDALDDAKATTVSLINALAPLQNCQQLVIDRFGYVPEIISPEEGL